MLDQVEDRGGLYQDRAVHQIMREFGVEWSYVNANGNRAIDKRIWQRSGSFRSTT